MDQLDANDDFYAGLAPMTRFQEVLDPNAYIPVPGDWVAMAGDIQGSTRAIEAGRYKAVNMVGAAVITSVLNACPGHDLPFSFGGDGGVVLVPASVAEAARAALARLQAHSERQFGLALRAAAVPVRRLLAEGQGLGLARLRLNGRNHLAMLAGSGVARIDEILKSGDPDDPDLILPGAELAPPDLEGLSCRWEPLSATRSRMIALMIQPAPGHGEAEILRPVLSRLTAILSGDMPAHAPARAPTLRFRWPPRGLALERRILSPLRGAFRATAWTYLTALAQKYCHWRGAKIGDYDGPQYLNEITQQTDFRKFDGMLRVVLDCSEEEIGEIRACLEAERQAGRLFFGLHADREALMTCLIFSLAESTHVHFIDAAGGGFAKAAEEMKAQIRAAGGS